MSDDMAWIPKVLVCVAGYALILAAIAMPPRRRGGNSNPQPTYPRPLPPTMPPVVPPREPISCPVTLRGGPCDGLTIERRDLTRHYEVPRQGGGAVRYTLARAEADWCDGSPTPPVDQPKFTVVPVLDSFDSAKVIGELRVLTDKLPPTPAFAFSLGYRTLDETAEKAAGTVPGEIPRKQYAGSYELMSVSPVSDVNLIGYFRQVGAIKEADQPTPPPSRIIREGDGK